MGKGRQAVRIFADYTVRIAFSASYVVRRITIPIVRKRPEYAFIMI